MMGIKKSDLTCAVILLLGTVLAMLNQTALNPALPSIMVDLSIDAATAQWLVSGYSLANAVVIPLSAYLMGRFGTRRLFLAAMTLFALGSFLGAAFPVFGVVMAGRVLQAVCAGINMPMMFAVMLLIFPREKRGSAMGIVTLAICFAPAIGPTVSGLLVDALGWRALFAFVCALALVLLAVAAAKLEPYGDFERVGFDAPSVAMVALGLLLLLMGISSLSSASSGALTAVCIVAGAVLIALFAKRQLSLKTPLLNVRVLATRNYRVAAIVVALIQATLIGLNVVMPLYIQNTLGYSALVSGLIMFPGAVLGGAGSVLAGRLFDRVGVRRCALPGLVVLFLGAVGLVLLRADSNVVLVTVVYAIILGALQYSNTPMNTWGVNSLENRLIQHGTALNNTLNQVAASLSTAALMIAVSLGSAASTAADPAAQAFAGQHLAFMVVLGIVAVALLTALLFARDKEPQGSTAAVAAREQA